MVFWDWRGLSPSPSAGLAKVLTASTTCRTAQPSVEDAASPDVLDVGARLGAIPLEGLQEVRKAHDPPLYLVEATAAGRALGATTG